MEEEIKILEEQLNTYKRHLENYEKEECLTNVYYELKKYATALENLIKGYRELEENKKLKTIKGFEENIEVSKFGEWVGKNYIDYKFEYENYQRILADYIPKTKIKEKIEELEECVKCLGNDGIELTYKESAEAQIQVLQELMEE